MAEERKADKMAGKGSVAGKVKEERQRKQSRLNQLMGYDQSTGRKR